MNEINDTQKTRTLAQRTGAGLEVTLYWSAQDDLVTVRVVDVFADECFEMSVDPDRAMFAYNHPFAYAAEQGLDYEALVLPAA